MANPTLTFESASVYLRAGFVLRAHGAEDQDGLLVRQEHGALEISRGDGAWEPVGSTPVFDLGYDVYDQKHADPLSDAAKLANAQPLDAPKPDETSVGPDEPPLSAEDEQLNAQAEAGTEAEAAATEPAKKKRKFW